MKQAICYLIILSISLITCKEIDSQSGDTYERLEVYSVKETPEEVKKDTLQYAEVSHMNKDGKLLVKYFYNHKNELKGKEVVSNDQFTSERYRSDYFDADGNQLSYYKHIKNKYGEIMSSTAFDAASDEFLRIERYRHVDGNRTVKEVRDVKDQIQRRMEFAFDENNNEIAIAISNSQGHDIFYERYKVSSVDDKNRWIEKWGFVNEKANSLRLRSFNNKLD